uniref:Uncharacterized protein n=1 Tax=Anguilla anguilla TaxID=7936 RepID=A0A0E9QJQ1_ANGAN
MIAPYRETVKQSNISTLNCEPVGSNKNLLS